MLQPEETIQDPLSDLMFDAAVDDTESNVRELKFVHKRPQKISRSSAECNNPARPIHEAEWNDKVHAPMLDLAFEPYESPVFHNLRGAP